MKELFLHNFDFVFLFYGVAFFFLGTASLVLYFRQKTKLTLPWLYLSVFGFTHGFNKWMEMLSVSLMEPHFLAKERNILFVLSFLCLLEFSRRSLRVIKGINVRPWVYLPSSLFLIFVIMVFESPEYFNAAVRYSVCLPAILATSYIFWNFKKEKDDESDGKLYKGLALIFFIYAFSSGLFVPEIPVWPASVLNYTSFLGVVHIPIQIFRGFFVTLIAFIFIYSVVKQVLGPSELRQEKLKFNLMLSSFVLLYFLFFLLGFRLLCAVDERETKHLEKLILSDAKLVADAIGNIDIMMMPLEIPPPEADYFKYRQLHERFSDLAGVSSFAKSIYLISFADGKPVLTVGSLRQIFPQNVMASFGKDVPERIIRDAFQSKQPTMTGAYKDSSGGQSFSIFVPILDSKGEIRNLLGMDIDGTKILRELNLERLGVIFVIMAFLVFLIVAYTYMIFFALKNRELEVQRRNLDKAMIRLNELKAELVRSYEVFREIVESSPYAIFGFDNDLRIIFWNHATELLYGYTKDETMNEKNPLLSKKISTLLDIEDKEPLILKVFKGETFEVQMVHRGKEGLLVVDASIFPVRDPQGHILFGMAFIKDITEHKRLQEQLEASNAYVIESQKKYKNLVNNLNVGVYRATLGPEGRFLEINPALVAMLEAGAKEELMMHCLRDFYLIPGKRKEFSDKLLKQGFVRNEEIEAQTLKGRHFWASVSATANQDEKGEVYFDGIIEDITEHKNTELKLLEERDRLSKIATSIGAGLCLLNRNLEIIWVNEAIESWFGRLDSIQGRKCFDIFRGKNVFCEECPGKKAFETGQMQTAEEVFIFPNGNRKDFLITSTPVKNSKGEVDQVLNLMLDITERKKVFELLEYERALSKNVIDSIADSLMVLDCQRRVVIDVNRQFLENTVLTKEDVIGKKCSEVNGHACPSCEVCEFDEVVKKGKIVEATHQHKDPKTGRMSYVDVKLSPLKNDKGEVIGVIHLARDVTERKKLEDDLRRYSESLESLVNERTKAFEKSMLMFRKLFETAQDGILIIEAQSGKIVDVNPFLLTLLERSRDEFQDLEFKNAAFFENPIIIECIFNDLKHKLFVYYDDITLKTSSGREITVELRVSTYFVEDKKIIQCNMRDITERKKLERVKSEFVSMVSHELRTPLSAIKEGVEIVADGTQGTLNKDQLECLGIALSNIKRLNRLIGDILDISKIQSNLLKVHPAPCDIYDAVDQVYSLVRIEIEKHDMVFVTDLERDLPLTLADKDRLTQILINLLNNAIKFTRERSRITLTCKKSGNFVEFGIKDEGSGIPEEELSRLFGKFVQLDNTLVRRVGGTGLGLYISRNLVEAMGGQIWAESIPGQGSVFKFTIPIYKENP